MASAVPTQDIIKGLGSNDAVKNYILQYETAAKYLGDEAANSFFDTLLEQKEFSRFSNDKH